ncbi:MAG TPA: GNAT family N-acetyltransferase [Actinoplanes sp.]|nr:GNAT family N-acetyltransferase [Actinoplanes sp.]
MAALPGGWTLRRPTLDDVPELLKLVHASDIAAVGRPDCTAAEVREQLTAPNTDMATDCWVALDAEGMIVGWAYPYNPYRRDRDVIEVYTWPERGMPAMRPLLDLLLGRAAVRGARFGHDPYQVRAGAIPAERAWIDTLTGAGFRFVKMYARMTVSLAGTPPAEPDPPPGITVRPVRHADEDEMRRFHATVEEAFRDTDHPISDYPAWRDEIAAETAVAWDEWLVGEVDGAWAGVLRSSEIGADDNAGWVKELAVLRPYRRRGVGAALLRRALAGYAAKGRAEAGLGVDMANPTSAIRLYRAVGMRPLYQAAVYQRSVRTSGLG